MARAIATIVAADAAVNPTIAKDSYQDGSIVQGSTIIGHYLVHRTPTIAMAETRRQVAHLMLPGAMSIH